MIGINKRMFALKGKKFAEYLTFFVGIPLSLRFIYCYFVVGLIALLSVLKAFQKMSAVQLRAGRLRSARLSFQFQVSFSTRLFTSFQVCIINIRYRTYHSRNPISFPLICDFAPRFKASHIFKGQNFVKCRIFVKKGFKNFCFHIFQYRKSEKLTALRNIYNSQCGKVIATLKNFSYL